MGTLNTSIDIAKRIAQSSTGPLPCPVCAASVNAENLAKHIGKVHPDDSNAPPWSGSDRAVLRPLIAWFVLIVLQGALLPVVGDLLLFPVGIEMGLWLLLFGAALMDKLPAVLELDGDRLVVRHALGLLRRSVTLPPTKLEVGSLMEERSSSISSSVNGPSFDVKAGSYLRIVGRKGSITLGSKNGTGIRKHWRGWTDGGRTKSWDITLPAGVLVSIEYLLADRGSLEPTPSD